MTAGSELVRAFLRAMYPVRAHSGGDVVESETVAIVG
jgi:hypothetical protein